MMADKARLENVMRSYLSSDKGANGAQSGPTLDKFLRCMICSGYYNDPRLLSCGHCACASCLNDYIRDTCRDKHIVCPVCKAPIECKSGGATDFPKSNLVSSLSQLQQQQATNASQICEFCKQSEDKIQAALKFCAECAHFLCGTCSENHNRTMLTRNHLLVDAFRASEHLVQVRSRSQMCNDHQDKKADLYCKRCDRVLCQICALVAHRQHQIVDMPSVAGQLKLELRKALQDVERRIRICEKYECTIEEVNKKNERLEENLDDHITKWAEDIKQRVDAISQNLKAQLKHKTEQLDELNRVYAEKVSDRLDLFRGLHECIEELLRVGTPNELYHLSADVKNYLQVVDGGSFSTSSVPSLQLLCLNDKLLSSSTYACEAIAVQAELDERDESRKIEELDDANEERQRLKIVSSVKYRVEPASVSKTWFPARCKHDTQKVQIRSIFYQEEKRTYLVGDIWNRCIKEFNEKGIFLTMWQCQLGWPIALAQTKNKNIACVEYDISLKQCSLVIYGLKNQVLSTVSLNFSGMYIGSIALSNDNHIIVPNHDERKICLYTENTKQKPRLISIDGRPEFVAHVKTSGAVIVTCPQDQLVYVLKGDHVMQTIRAADLGAKSWRPYCVAASVSDSRFVVQDGFHPDQDRLLVFDENGTLMRMLPQDRVWIRVFIDARSRLVLCDKQNVAIYTCSWLQVAEKNLRPIKRIRQKSDRERCPAHPKKVTEVYCEDCNESICQLCTMLKHNGHSLVDLTAREPSASAHPNPNVNPNMNLNGFDTDSLTSSSSEAQPIKSSNDQQQKQQPDVLWWLTEDVNNQKTNAKNDSARSVKSKDAGETSLKHLVPVKEFPYKWKLFQGSKLVSEFKTHRGEPAAATILDGKIVAIERISEIQSVAVFYNFDSTVDRFVDMQYGLNPSNILLDADSNILVPGGGETAMFLYSKDCSTCIAQFQFPNFLPEFIAYSAATNCVAVSFPSEIDAFVTLTNFADRKLGSVTQQVTLTSKQVDDGLCDSWTPRALCFIASMQPAGETLCVFDESSRRILQFTASGKWIRTAVRNVEDCEYLYALDEHKVLVVGRNTIQVVSVAA